MAYKAITLEKRNDGIAILTLNRPEKLNALDKDMRIELGEAAVEFNQDDELSALIVTGAGRGFCSGGDINYVSTPRTHGEFGDSRHALRQPWPAWSHIIAQLDKPTIAAVNGIAIGAGLAIALVCDIGIASETATFGSAWVQRGLTPDCGTSYFLPRTVGLSKAYELAFTGDIINAHEAKQIGLVNRVVKQEDLMKTAVELALKIASGPPLAIELTKRVFRSGLETDLISAQYNENRAEEICHGTEDFQEGIKAFLEKRKANFRGK